MSRAVSPSVSRSGLLPRALLFAASVVLASGCVDTELGLDAMVDDARITVSGAGVSGSFDVTYRVGEHAEGDRTFQPQAFELLVGDALVATLSPSAPPGFVSRVSPGDSYTVTFEAAASSAVEPTRLCGADVVVVFRWFDASTSEIGMTETTITDVSCI